MPNSLAGSVGQGGRNLRADVILVQTLLKARGFNPGGVDGLCGGRTIAAIRAFQAGFLSRPDGLIDVGGTTWNRLNQATAGGAPGADASFTRLVPRPLPSTVNQGLAAVNNRFMTDLFGSPRASYNQDCQPLTNELLRRNVRTARVGVFQVTGLGPAIQSLQEVFAEISRTLPDLHALIGTAGMLCCRFQRNSTTAISNHSWGTAIDLKINGLLDARGDGTVQHGLTLIAPIFNQFGWYWGATFPVEDGMHFEVSRALAERVRSQLA
jgi:hypothetical protein